MDTIILMQVLPSRFLKMLFAGIKGYKYDNITDEIMRLEIKYPEEDKNPEGKL